MLFSFNKEMFERNYRFQHMNLNGNQKINCKKLNYIEDLNDKTNKFMT